MQIITKDNGEHEYVITFTSTEIRNCLDYDPDERPTEEDCDEIARDIETAFDEDFYSLVRA